MAPELQTTPCPHCGKVYTSNTRICPDDGSVIEHVPSPVSHVGAVLDGKYRLDAFLSQGGMGAVYRATHVMLGKTIAVKLINPELVSTSEIVRRFQREARAATALNHPNIVAVYDLGQTSDGTLYIAMEFVDGPSLKDAIARGHGMAPARAIALLRQVAAALSRAHRHGIVHRDLKPQNIMLAHSDDGREQVKLVDFGIAKTFDEGTQLTSTGFLIGTPHYMPPEQASGGTVDARSDLYSVGVILYEMLTGEVPFDDASTPAILVKQVRELPLPPSVRITTPGVIPPVLDAIALRLLEKDPANRYQTADELGAALDEAAAAIPTPDVTLSMPRHSATPVVRSTSAQNVAASVTGPTVDVPGRTSAPPPPATTQSASVQNVNASASEPTRVTAKRTPAQAPAAPISAVAAAVAIPTPAAQLPLPSPTSAAAPAKNSSAFVLIAFLVAGIIATAGAAYYFNGRGSSVSTDFATNSAPATNAPATEAAASPSPQASTPAPAPPTAAPPASPPSVPAGPPANAGETTRGAAAAAKPVETASKAAAPSVPAPVAGNARVNPPSAGNPPSPRVTTSAPPPPARGSAPPPQGQPPNPPARGSAPAASAAPAAVALAAPATQAPATRAPGAAAQAPAAAAARREVPVAAPATFPEKPAVFFRCTGPTEVCNPLRTAVDEALGGAGLTIVRRANGADIDVEAQVEMLQQNVDRQFGTTFAVRTYSIVMNGDTTKTGEVVSMPSVDNLSFDPRVGSERANERARLVAAGVVERVKAFAAAKRAR